jgi:hypothetical protein
MKTSVYMPSESPFCRSNAGFDGFICVHGTGLAVSEKSVCYRFVLLIKRVTG